jgi:hypothetical protein
MSNTLTYKDTIQRTGYTVIDDVRVVQYTCVIPADKPQEMRLGITKLNPELYKANREICRADYAAFEDAAYQLQEECIARLGN